MPRGQNFTSINTANILQNNGSAPRTRSGAASGSEQQTRKGPRAMRNNRGAAASRSSLVRTESRRQGVRHNPITRSDRVAQRARAARQGWITRRRRNVAVAAENSPQTSHHPAGDSHARIEVRIPTNTGHEPPVSVVSHEPTASAPSNLEGRQANESHRDHRMALDFLLTAPGEPASSTTSNRHDGNSEARFTAEESHPPVPAATSSTTSVGSRTLTELIEELRRRPGYPWHNNQSSASCPGSTNMAARPLGQIIQVAVPVHNTNRIPEQHNISNNAPTVSENTGTSTARTSSYVPPLPPPPSTPTRSTLLMAESLYHRRTPAMPSPPSHSPPPSPTSRLLPRPNVGLTPTPDRPGITVHRASPESASNNRYRNPTTYLGQPLEAPRLVPRDEVALREALAARVQAQASASARTERVEGEREERARAREREEREERETEEEEEAREREREGGDGGDEEEENSFGSSEL